MKKILSLLAFVLFGVSTICAARTGFLATDPESAGAKQIRMELIDGNLLVVQIENRGADDRWELYRAAFDEAGSMELTPVVAFDVDYGKNLKIKPLPAPASIIAPTGDQPRFSGSYKLALEPSKGVGIHNDYITMMRAYNDYTLNPESYPADSLAAFPAHKYALNDTYTARIAARNKAVREMKQTAESNAASQAKWFELALLLPLILALGMRMRTRGNRISAGFHGNARTIAILEVVALAFIIAAICALPLCSWPYIILGVVCVIALLWLYLVFGASVYDHVKYARGGKFPWLAATVFALLGIMTVGGIAVTLLALGFGSYTGSVGEALLGIALSLVLTGLAGWWYRHALLKNAPGLAGSFLPIAVITICSGIAIWAFAIVIIALFIFKGSARQFLQAGNEAAGSGSRNSELDICENCALRTTPACPHMGVDANAGCPSFKRKP